METGPRFKVSSERLEEREIEPATPGLQDYNANHCATASYIKQEISLKKGKRRRLNGNVFRNMCLR